MTLPEVLRVVLIRTGSELKQKVITRPHGYNICPQVETVLLAMPIGMTAAACRDFWDKFNEKPFNLIIDSRVMTHLTRICVKSSVTSPWYQLRQPR